MRSNNRIVQQIFYTPWHFMRWLRLGIGLYAVINLFFTPFNIFFLLFGLLFMYQALFNTGCCGVQSFQDTNSTKTPKEADFVDYQEIK